MLRANEDGSAVETGFLHRWMWFSLILRREVSVLSLLTGRDETSLTGERQSLVFLLQKGLACAHLFGFSRFLFFSFFFLCLVNVRCLFWIVGVGAWAFVLRANEGCVLETDFCFKTTWFCLWS